jgi:hypothetical protein
MVARIMMMSALSLAAMSVVSIAGCGKQEPAAAPKVAAKKDGEAPPKVAQTDKDSFPPPPMFPPPPQVDPPKVIGNDKGPAVVKPKLPPPPPPVVKRERVKPTDTVALTAEAFGGEFRKDAEAAAKKFDAAVRDARRRAGIAEHPVPACPGEGAVGQDQQGAEDQDPRPVARFLGAADPGAVRAG